MNPYSLWPILAAFALVWLICTVVRVDGPAAELGRQSSLDGLRGFLAFSVFLHHASFYYELPTTGEFLEPPSAVYAHLGDSSVKLFFMITGFLFYSKLLRAKARKSHDFDWLGLYAGRFCRIVPMYWCTIFAMFVVVGIVTGFQLREPAYVLVAKMVNWLNFFFTTQPDLNGLKLTKLILSGVIWTLIFEWMFYMFLPVLGAMLGLKVTKPFWLLTVIPIVWLLVFVGFKTRTTLISIVPFAGGIFAAYVHQNARWASQMKGRVAGAVALAALGLNVALTPNGHNFVTPIFLLIAFVPIACGNTLFGMLQIKAARFLGEISFSIYLLHGMLLYVTFYLVIPHFSSVRLSPEVHWAVIVGLVPILLALSTLTFKRVESKWLHATPRLTENLRRFPILRKNRSVTE